MDPDLLSPEPPWTALGVRGPTPLVYLVGGHRAGVAWCSLDGLYTASAAALPGLAGRGATRRDALAALARAIAGLSSPSGEGVPAGRLH